MSYTDMLEALEKTFDSNIQKVRRKMLFGDTGETLSVPSTSNRKLSVLNQAISGLPM
jgi:hypothetical protein